MEPEVKKLLFDIIESLNAIESYVGKTKLFAEYQKNKMVRRAVERELEIIGEAMNRLLGLKSNISISDARRVVDFRNRISHGYDSVDDEIVWGIVINHLPTLMHEVGILLNQK